MARTRRQTKLFDKDAPKNKVIQFRINSGELINIERMKHKLGVSKSEIFRIAMTELYKRTFPDE